MSFKFIWTPLIHDDSKTDQQLTNNVTRGTNFYFNFAEMKAKLVNASEPLSGEALLSVNGDG